MNEDFSPQSFVPDQKALDKIIDKLRKEHGDHSLINFNGQTVYPKIESISTGSMLLDRALGIGGIPIGRMTEFWGHEGGGKSTIEIQTLIQAQKKFPNKQVALIDAEYNFDLNRAVQLGLSPDKFYLVQPETSEQGWDIIEGLLRTSAFSVIALDSIAAMVPDKEEEDGIEQQQVGLQSRLNTKAMRKLKPLVAKSNTAFLVINQARANLKAATPYSPVEVAPGGFGLAHTCSVIIHINRIGWFKNTADDVVGINVKAEVLKNHCAPPKKDAEFTIYFDRGVHQEEELVNIAIDLGFVKQAGPWYRYEDKQIGQGKLQAAKWLLDNPEASQKVIDAFYSR